MAQFFLLLSKGVLCLLAWIQNTQPNSSALISTPPKFIISCDSMLKYLFCFYEHVCHPNTVRLAEHDEITEVLFQWFSTARELRIFSIMFPHFVSFFFEKKKCVEIIESFLFLFSIVLVNRPTHM